MASVEKKLKEMEIECIKRRVEEGGVYVDQLFFHDPNGFMIEICNCDNLPVIPLGGGQPVGLCKRVGLVKRQHGQTGQAQAMEKVQWHSGPAIIVSEDSHISCA